jgi:hypothetical protein
MTITRIQVNGRTCWVNEVGQFHREDGPAVIYDIGMLNGTREEWYLNNHLHRDGGPAIIGYVDGKIVSQYWYVHGTKHRDIEPAVIQSDGRMEWWHHGLLHRLNGPAVICENGVKVWYLHGCRVNTNIYMKMKNPAKSKYPDLAMSIITSYVHES